MLYKRGNTAEALATQQDAVSLLPAGSEWNIQYSEYYYRLGPYLAKSGKDEGLRVIGRTVFFGISEAPTLLDELLAGQGAENAGKRKQQLLSSVAKESIERGEDPISARAIVAMSLAQQNIMLDDALRYAEEAQTLLTKRSAADERLLTYTALGVVEYHRGEYRNAARHLSDAGKLVSPYSREVYLYLGRVYEAVGNLRGAFDAYLMGVVAFRPPELMEPLTRLHENLYDQSQYLDSLIFAKAREVEQFEPGNYQRSGGDRVVLAELFTGSECKPCAASDIAYDKLIERYDRSTLAVLEYHLHIPAPAPMTNTDTEARAKFYGVTSTPTSFIDGIYKSAGGGPPVAARSRFEVYKHKSHASMTMSGRLADDVLTVEVSSTTSVSTSEDVRLYVALAEEDVEYGSPLNMKGFARMTESLHLGELQDSLRSHLDSYEARTPGGKAFKEKKHDINSRNLWLVAFLQNSATKEILQARVHKLTSS